MKTIAKRSWSIAVVLASFLLLSCDDEGDNNSLPDIGITAPADKSVFKTGEAITINAFATGENGKVSQVDFYEGKNKLGSDPIAPYEFTWTDAKAGNYTITITTVDEDGNENGSASISIDVVDAI